MDTIITKNHILKLELYQITSVNIYDEVEQVSEDASKESRPITQQKDFKKFVKTYGEQVNALKGVLPKIALLGRVDFDELNHLANNISSEINNHKNLFNYLYRIKSTDETTYTHSINVSIYANIFAKWLGLMEKDVMNLTISGILHDIGKTQIPNEVLNKPGRLSDTEFKIMKTHASLGYKMICNTTLDDGIKQAVLAHHEKLNGCGYPF